METIVKQKQDKKEFIRWIVMQGIMDMRIIFHKFLLPVLSFLLFAS